MPRVFLPQILWHSKDNKRCDRVYSIDFQPRQKEEAPDKSKNTTTLRLATGGADEFVHIWQITIQDHAPQYTNFLKQNPEAKADFEQPLSIKILARLVGHIGEVNSVRWSHDGRILASGGEDRCIFLWVKGSKQGNLNEDAHNDYEEHWTRTHYFRLSNVVNTICWCPDDRILSVSTEDGHVSLVDTQVEGAGKIRYFDGHTSFAQGVSLDPKNELLASLGSDQCLRVWKRRNQKQWKNVLVLKAARDRGDLVTITELENSYELRKYSRYVFMSEELKTFFRRLDWSPDGRLLVAPTGIRHKNSPASNANTSFPNANCAPPFASTDGFATNPTANFTGNPAGNPTSNLAVNFTGNSVNPTTNDIPGTAFTSTNAASGTNTTAGTNTSTAANDNGSMAGTEGGEASNPADQLDNTVYTLYVFHRKLLNLGIPMLTHQSPTGPFVVVKFCPIYLSLFDKKRQNFYNLLLNAKKNKLKPIKKKLERTSKTQTTLVNKINTYFTSAGASQAGEAKGPPEEGETAQEGANEAPEPASQYEADDEDDEDEILTMLEENENETDNVDNTTTNTEYNSDSFNVNPDPFNVNSELGLDYHSMQENTTPLHYSSPDLDPEGSNDADDSEMAGDGDDNPLEYREEDEQVADDRPEGRFEGHLHGHSEGRLEDKLDSQFHNKSDTQFEDEFDGQSKEPEEPEEPKDNEETFEDPREAQEWCERIDEADQEAEKIEETHEEAYDVPSLDLESRETNHNNMETNCDNTEGTNSNIEIFYKSEQDQEANDLDTTFEDQTFNKMKEEDALEREEFMVKNDSEPVLIKEEQDDEGSEDLENDPEDSPVNGRETDPAGQEKDQKEESERAKEQEGVKEEEGKEGAQSQNQDCELQPTEREDERRVYNLRTKRKSVFPLLFENYASVPKRPKPRAAGEKKKKAEEEPQEEDYDTDLEEELSVPRFLFAAGTTDGSLCFFDTKENSGPIAVLKNLHFCPITDISWSPDGYVCATSSSDGYITFVIFNKRELS